MQLTNNRSIHLVSGATTSLIDDDYNNKRTGTGAHVQFTNSAWLNCDFCSGNRRRNFESR